MTTYSHSDIVTANRCWKKYKYSVVDRIQRKRQDVPMHVGRAGHAMLRDQALGQPVAKTVEALEAEVLANPNLFADEKYELTQKILFAESIVLRYLAKVQPDYKVLLCEEEITLDLGFFKITMTPDLVVEYPNGDIWIVDHKFMATIPSELPIPNYQVLLYVAGVRALYGDRVRGFEFNYLRKKEPTQPRLTKTGDRRVADLARIDTTYEILYQFLRDEAPDLLDDPAHRERLAELRMHDRFFSSHHMYVTPVQLANALEDVEAHLVAMWVKDHKLAQDPPARYPRSYIASGYMACERCEFKEICQGELLGWDTQAILENSYEPRAAKNPYESEEDDE